MPQTAAPRTDRRKDLVGLAISIAVVIVISVIGGIITASSVDGWYQELQKPAFNPPDWLFAPVWSLLYFMMAVAVWLVWRRVGLAGAALAVGLYVVQLTLNLGWTILFFGAQEIGLALVEIAILFVAILATAWVFRRTHKVAAALMIPYAAWVAFAAALNAAIWNLN